MKWHHNLLVGVINGLEQFFFHKRRSVKVVEELFEKNKKWGSRDRKIVSYLIFENVRWVRKFAYCSNIKELSTKKDLWSILGSSIVIKDRLLPNFIEFSHLDSKKILNREKKIKNNRKISQSIPDWIDSLGVNDFGNKIWDKEIKALNIKSNLVLRCNTLKSNINHLKKELSKNNIDSFLIKEYPHALIIKEPKKITNLSCFKMGYFEIQDANSQKVALSCNLKTRMTVIDACAGAGGKSLHMASIMKNKGEIIALDPFDNKLKELNNRAIRNGIDIIRTLNTSNKNLISNIIGKADRVLIDAPCSGLGVLKRNPDAKWNMTPKKIKDLIKVQDSLLEEWSKYLKKGGELIYATCSIFKNENTNRIKTFLKSESGKNFKIVKEKTFFSYSTGFDGFYIAQLKNCE